MSGWLSERHAVAGSKMLSSKRKRYAMFDMQTNTFSCYLTEESALLGDVKPQLRVQASCRAPPHP